MNKQYNIYKCTASTTYVCVSAKLSIVKAIQKPEIIIRYAFFWALYLLITSLNKPFYK